MSYMQALHKLRKSIKDTPEKTTPVLRSSFISRMDKDEPEDTDPLSLSREWIQTIRSSGESFRASLPKSSPMDFGEEPKPVVEEEPEVTEEEEEEETKRKSMFDGVESSTGGPGRTVDIGSATTLKEAVVASESGGSYDTLFGHSEGNKFAGVNVSKMTIGELKRFSAPSGEYGQWVKGQVGRVATPMGRYQFVGSTMGEVANEMGLSDDTVFSPRVQDAMFDFQANKVMNRGATIRDKVSKLRSEWEGLKHVPTAQLVSIVRDTA